MSEAVNCTELAQCGHQDARPSLNTALIPDVTPGASRRRRISEFQHGIRYTAWCAVLCAMLCGCGGYIPGRQSYWDEQVRQMCEKDGGVIVYETIELSQAEYQRLGGMKEGFPIPDERHATAATPYVREERRTTIRDSNPTVVRGETLIKRRSDNKVLARSVRYWRTGGDIPTGIAHESYFICPEQVDISRRVFSITDSSK